MTELMIEVPGRLGAEAAGKLQDFFRQVAPTVLSGIERNETENVRKLVAFLVESTEPTPFDLKKANLRATAMKAILQGTEWLTAEQVGREYGRLNGNPAPANAAAVASRWKNQNEMFAIAYKGRDWYPKYAFGLDFRPLPVMRDVLAQLSGLDPWSVAAWFESTSSFLGGQRPREVIAHDGQRVLAAAQDRLLQAQG
jgi:hypothetical protein